MSDGEGCGATIVFLALIGTLAYCQVSRDPTPGLTYQDGDRPTEMGHSLCFSDSGPCPPYGYRWSARTIRAGVHLDERKDRKLHGTMALTAYCPATVDWALTVDGTTIAVNSVSADEPNPERFVATVPRGAKTVTLLVRRTDDQACDATFEWRYAALNNDD